MKQYCKSHKITERIRRLDLVIEGVEKDLKELKSEYEKIDRDMYRGCIAAENRVVVQVRSMIPWSRELAQATNSSRYWKLRRRQEEGIEVNDKLMRSLGKELGLDENDGMNLEEIRFRAAVTANELHKVRRASPETRVRFLKSLAEQFAEENKTSKEIAIRELMKHEEIREIFKEIGHRLKPI